MWRMGSLIIVAVALPRLAAADVVIHEPGNSCAQILFAGAPTVLFSVFGITNFAGNSETYVHCPVDQRSATGTAVIPLSARVFFRDRNVNTGPAPNIMCRFFGRNGAALFEGVATFSCNTPSGCETDAGETGVMDLVVPTVPVDRLWIDCWLPRVGIGPSRIMGYEVRFP
jgi:hypothetical protein